MADKKFLGLGFTFSATDKGLEQKLSNVSNVIQQISEGLDEVNKQFDKMTGTKTVNVKAKLPSSTSGKTKSKPRGTASDSGFGKELVNLGRMQVVRLNMANKFLGMIAKNRSSFHGMPNQAPRLVQRASATGRVSDLSSGFGKELITGLRAMREFVKKGGGSVSDFEKRLNKMSVSLDSTGKFTSSTVDDLNDLAFGLIADKSAMRGLSKELATFKVMLGSVGEYFKEVGGSGNEFLKSLGIDFGKIIPDQFKAAGRLLATTISGPFKAVGKLFGAKSNSVQEKFLEEMKDSLNKISNQIGGQGRKNKNLFTNTSDIDENTKEKKSKGIFDGLKDFFTKPLSMLFGALGGLKALSLLPFNAVSKAFSSVISLLGRFKIGGAEALAAIYVLSAAFTGLWKGLSKSFDSLKNGMTLLWQGVTNLFEGIWELGKALTGSFLTSIGDWISKMSEGSTVLTFLVDAFTGLWKTIQKGWENIGELIGSVLGLLGDKLGGLLFNWGDKLKDVAKSFSAPSANTQIQPNNVVRMADYQKDLTTGIGTVADKTGDLRESLLKSSKESQKTQEEHTILQKTTNDKLEQLIGIMGNSTKEMPTINLMNNFDARKYGLSVRQDENDQIAASKF